MTIQISVGDSVRVRRHLIQPDGTSEQAADWTGTVLALIEDHGNPVSGIELDTAGCLGLADQHMGRGVVLRTTVEPAGLAARAGESR